MRLSHKFVLFFCLVVGAHVCNVAATIQAEPSVVHGSLTDKISLKGLTGGLDELSDLDPDNLLEDGLREHLYTHLVTAFRDLAHQHKDTLENWDVDRLLEMDTSLGGDDKTQLRKDLGSLDDTINSVLPTIAGSYREPKHHRARSPKEEIEFVIRANRDIFHDAGLVVSYAEHRHVYKVTAAGKKGHLFLRHRGTTGGFEWSPKGSDTCFTWLKTQEPPCWFHSRSDLNPHFDMLIKKLRAHENIPVGVAAKDRPSVGEVAGALGFGFFDGVFMGMGSFFRDAIRHADCEGAGDALHTASHAFAHALKNTASCAKNIVTFHRGSVACKNQNNKWRHALHAFRNLSGKCGTLKRNVGFLVTILLIALVAFKVAGALLGSAAGPIGTAVGATLGLAVKLFLIVLAAGGALKHMFRTVRVFLHASGRCRRGPCVKPDIVAMLESGAGFVGVWIGLICLSGLDKIIKMPKFRELFRGARPRFQPKFLDELESVGRAWSNARAGRQVTQSSLNAGQVTDDVAKVADDAGKATDDVAKVADDAGKVTDDVAKVTDDVARNADDAANAAKLKQLDSEIAEAKKSVDYWSKKSSEWKPSPQKDYVRMEHVGNGKFEPRNYGKPAQYNPHRNALSDAQSKLRKLVSRKNAIINPPKPVPMPVKDPYIQDIIKVEKQLSKVQRDFAYFKRTNASSSRAPWLERIDKLKQTLQELKSHPQPKNSLPRALERVFAEQPALRTSKGTTTISGGAWSGTIRDGVPVDLIKQLQSATPQ